VIRHVYGKPPLAVEVQLDGGGVLTVDGKAADVQSFAKLQSLVADTLGVWLRGRRRMSGGG
jgi:hypothetical protein